MGGERGVHVLACVGPAFQPFRNNHPATPRPQDNLKIGQNCRPAVSSASRRPSTLSAHRACSSATGGGREHSAVTPLRHNIAVNGSALPTRRAAPSSRWPQRRRLPPPLRSAAPLQQRTHVPPPRSREATSARMTMTRMPGCYRITSYDVLVSTQLNSTQLNSTQLNSTQHNFLRFELS